MISGFNVELATHRWDGVRYTVLPLSLVAPLFAAYTLLATWNQIGAFNSKIDVRRAAATLTHAGL
jgi:hypothetical protein